MIVTGGAGKHSAFIPTFGETRSVTRALTARRRAREIDTGIEAGLIDSFAVAQAAC